MRLFTYIVAHDRGFAPNPFWGYCTLATCKPKIRNVAQKGDWIVGLSPKALGNKLVYAMKVEEKLTHDQYFNDPRFAAKKPEPESPDSKRKCGDNMYYRAKCNGLYEQSKSAIHGAEDFKRDTSSEYVLISAKDDFYYFGKDAKELPSGILQKIVVGRGHRSNFEQSTIKEGIEFLSRLPKGINGEPRDIIKRQ
jgi:hypothetical protein